MRVLITGMSATGKSTVVRELRARGYPAWDADDDGFTEPREHGGWGWRTDLVDALLATEGLVVLAGCADEQRDYAFDLTILLTVPEEELLRRLGSRTTGAYGSTAAERDRVLEDRRVVEPLLRAVADLVIDTTAPLEDVVAHVERALTA